MTVPPRISVIVPLRGVGKHVEGCLESLRDQTLRDLEVILVGDPGAAAVRDPRFTVVPLGDCEVGAARNAGVALATGDYLAFADGDAVVPADAYLTLVQTLDRTGSDLACGRARRLAASESSTRECAAFGTHITRHPKLIHDTAATNKVFRRAFWDEHGFAFPEGLRADFPVTIPAHVRSRSTDVLGDIVYLTRGPDREQHADPARRLAAMLEISDFISTHAPELSKLYDAHLAEDPGLASLLDAVHVPQGLRRLLDLAPALARVHPRAVDRLPALRRLQLFLLARGMVGELGELQRFAKSEIMDRGVVRRGLLRPRWYVDYPLRRDSRIPGHLFDAERDMELRACVDDVRHSGGRLSITGHAYITHLDSRRSGVEIWLQRGDKRIELPIRRVPRPDVTADSQQSAVCHDKSGFVAEIDVQSLARGRWALHARVSARGVTRAGRMTGGPHAGERAFHADGMRVTLTQHRGLTLKVGDSAGDRDDSGNHGGSGDRVTAVRWTEAHELVLTGVGESRTGEIALLRGTERHAWPVHREGGRWTATIGRTADGLPPRSGTWRVLSGEERVRLSPGLVADLPGPHTTGVHEISFRTTRASELSLVVRPALGPEERGRYASRRRLGTSRRHTRLTNAALFDSYGGGQYSCNPRAVSEELGRRRPDMELIWVTRDGQFTVPAGVRTVLYGSREHEEALHSCRFVVANRRTQPSWYGKPPGQMFVQTWHGTPLKRLGRDIEGMPYAQRDLDEDLERYAGMWDLLISPNPFSTPILRRAFGYGGEILESGYPRNDVLFSPERGRSARRRLGVPEDSRVILYAPTWRDDEIDRPGLELDVGRATEALGESDVLLVRAHYLVADRITIPGGALDVSKFPDMADLLAATDVLVTDYSSAMFDFACTGRPMVFFTYDLERYREEVRGFYFDFESEAPGPIVRTTDEVLQALKYSDFASFKARYQDFSDKFCPWDDGHASERVVARMLS